MNVHFVNFSNEDFISKNAKAKMKKLIKESISLEDQSKFNELKVELIERCLKSDSNYTVSLNYIIENNDFKLSIVKEDLKDDLKEKKREELKRIIKEKILNSRNQEMTQRQFDKKEKQLKKQISHDERISVEMTKAYNQARFTFGMKIPNPIEIINNKDKYVNEVFQHILNLSQKCDNNKEKLFQLLDNDYINYVQMVCGFNYKQYIDQFFKKVNDMTDNSSNVPEIIKENSNNSAVKEDELTSNIKNALNDTDDENEDIHSDDEN